MKNKTPLQLMEQIIMIGVFALAAALCLQAYALSHKISANMALQESAVHMADNLIESLRANTTPLLPDITPNAPFTADYDQDWELTTSNPTYHIVITWPDPGDLPVTQCNITITAPDNTEYVSRNAVWQS